MPNSRCKTSSLEQDVDTMWSVIQAASCVGTSPCGIHTSAERSRLRRWRSPSVSAFSAARGLLVGPLRRRRGPPRCACGCGHLCIGRPLRGRRSGQGLGRIRSTECLGPERGAEVVLQSRLNEVRVSVEERGGGRPQAPTLRHGVYGGRRSPGWPGPSKCPERRHNLKVAVALGRRFALHPTKHMQHKPIPTGHGHPSDSSTNWRHASYPF